MVCLSLPARRPTVSGDVCASVSLSGECRVVSHYDSDLNILMAWKKISISFDYRHFSNDFPRPY